MKIICLQEKLKYGLSIVERIIGKNLTLPVLNNILLKTEKNALKISSTDLEIGINVWLQCKIEKNGSITIPARLLSNFIYNLPNKNVHFELKANNLNIKCDNYKATIHGISSKEFPLIPEIKTDSKIEINSKNFKEALNQVEKAAAVIETRPEISGIFLKFNKNSLKVVATDSFRLGERVISFDKKIDLGSENSMIIPFKTASELIRILGDRNEKVRIGFEKNQIMFSLSDAQLVSRLIEGNYPNYEQIIPSNFQTEIIINREEFLNAVKVASFFSSKVNDVNVKVSPKTVEVYAKDPELGENKVSLNPKIKGKDTSVSFNYKYVIDGLNNISTKQVFLGLNNETGPAALKPVGNNNYIYIVMPIRS